MGNIRSTIDKEVPSITDSDANEILNSWVQGGLDNFSKINDILKHAKGTRHQRTNKHGIPSGPTITILSIGNVKTMVADDVTRIVENASSVYCHGTIARMSIADNDYHILVYVVDGNSYFAVVPENNEMCTKVRELGLHASLWTAIECSVKTSTGDERNHTNAIRSLMLHFGCKCYIGLMLEKLTIEEMDEMISERLCGESHNVVQAIRTLMTRPIRKQESPKNKPVKRKRVATKEDGRDEDGMETPGASSRRITRGMIKIAAAAAAAGTTTTKMTNKRVQKISPAGATKKKSIVIEKAVNVEEEEVENEKTPGTPNSLISLRRMDDEEIWDDVMADFPDSKKITDDPIDVDIGYLFSESTLDAMLLQ